MNGLQRTSPLEIIWKHYKDFIAPILPRVVEGKPTRRAPLFIEELEQGGRHQFLAIITADTLRTPILRNEPSEDFHDSLMRERACHLNGHTPASLLILDGQPAKCLAIRRDIMHKLPTPHRVFRLRGGLQRGPRPDYLPRLPLREL